MTKKQIAKAAKEYAAKNWDGSTVSPLRIEQFFLDGATVLQKELDAARNEIKSLKFQLENKSKEIGRSEHRGNTVDYIYDKLENYSRQLGETVDSLFELKKELKDQKHRTKVYEKAALEWMEEYDKLKAKHEPLVATYTDQVIDAKVGPSLKDQLEAADKEVVIVERKK